MEPEDPSPALGPYALRRELARGGTGAVYEATDRRTGETVALKVLDPFLARDAETAARFRREAAILAGLDHENIVGARGSVGEEGSRLFFAMERVQGRALADLLRARVRLAPPLAVEVALQLLRGLAAAHAGGIVHRDLTPSNLILQRGEGGVRVRIADFGLAHAQDLTRLTRTGEVLGTLLYRAPEQCLGLPAGEAADLYAAGAILFEMLAGTPPFRGATPLAIFEAHQTAPVPDLPQDLGPSRETLQRLIRTAMAKRPQDRFPDADAFGRELEDSGIPPPPDGAWDGVWTGDTTVAPSLQTAGGPADRDPSPPTVPRDGLADRAALPPSRRDPGTLPPPACHRCGRVARGEEETCDRCRRPLRPSLFPARCLSWVRLDLFVSLAAAAGAAVAAVASPRAAAASGIGCAGAVGAAILAARGTYGTRTCREIGDAIGRYARSSPALTGALAAVAAGICVRAASALVPPLGILAWTAPPVCLTLLALHPLRYGRSRREAVARLRDRLRSHWDVEGHPGAPLPLERLRERFQAGSIPASARVRGGGTDMRWERADRIPALSRALGRCHRCGGAPGTEDDCRSCGAPLYDVRPLGVGLPSLAVRISAGLAKALVVLAATGLLVWAVLP